MNFFRDYSNLSSEEILEKIFAGEIEYSTRWSEEESEEKFLEEVRERRERGKTHGQRLKESLEEREEYWMKEAKDFRVDLRMAFFDTRRVFVEDAETDVLEGMGIALMKKLTRISRGVLNPTDVQEEWSKWRGYPPPEVKEYFYRNYRYWNRCSVFFEFRDEKHAIDFYCGGDWLLADPAIKKINELIKDTGYQYYEPREEYIVYIVFSENEAEKLKRDRGWEFFSLINICEIINNLILPKVDVKMISKIDG